MEKLSPDLLQFLVLDYDLDSLIKLCQTNKRMNFLICSNSKFWRTKLYKEYPKTIGKFPPDSDFRKIYLSLVNNKKEKYYTFISYKEPIKFWNYIKKSPLTGEDFDLVEILYSDFIDKQGEDLEFQMVGEYPIGTKIWLAYSDNRDIDIKEAFLSREEAINKILTAVGLLLKSDFDDQLDFNGKNPEEFYGGAIDEVMERYKKDLTQNNYIQILDHVLYYDINFIIKDFEIVNYSKMLDELKRKNPNWKKLPKNA